MIKKEIITIAGPPGSGKSTTAKLLATALGYEHFSSGDLFREIARQHAGIDVDQANLHAEKEPSIDEAVDARLREIGANDTKKVIDSRTAWHWIPGAFKVYLQLDFDTAAARIMAAMDEKRLKYENIPASPSEYAKQLKRRLHNESRRYLNLYGIDPYSSKNHDFVINTATQLPEETVAMILTAYHARNNK